MRRHRLLAHATWVTGISVATLVSLVWAFPAASVESAGSRFSLSASSRRQIVTAFGHLTSTRSVRSKSRYLQGYDKSMADVLARSTLLHPVGYEARPVLSE